MGGILRDASFATLSYVLLNTCINHPLLTVDSERQLCEALLDWLAINNQCSKLISCNTPNNYFQILEKVRIGLLPLEFILGRLWRDYPKMVASLQKMTIFDQISSNDHSNIQDGELDMFRLRLTQYNEKLDLSKCQQVTGKMLFFFLLPPATMDATLCSVASSETLKNLVEKLMTARSTSEGVQYQALEESHLAASFSNLKEVNISCCWRLHEEDIIEWLRLLSPCLRIFISQYCSQLKISILYKLSQVCPLIEEVDLTVDISPAISHKVSILHVSCEAYPGSQTSSNWMLPKGSTLSNLTRLSLKGRTDIQDNDLRIITVLSHSINFLDLGGCISLTDLGISCFLTSCTQLRSLHVAWTSFGQHSIKSLLSSTNHKESLLVENDFALSLNSCSPLIELDIGGCRDIDEIFLIKYIESAYSLSCLSMRHTNLGDEVLYAFKGTSLKELDVCETLVSGKALSHIIVRNPGLKILKARGCKRMANCFYHVQVHDPSSFHQNSELIQAMGRLLNLQELAVGWGLSGFSVAMMKPVLASLKCLTVGLGGSLGTQIWLMLPEICPLLEYISVCFQTVSDEGVLHVLKNLRYMHTLELQHCFGELSSKILSVSVSNLKSLRLDRVAPWMTDENLDMLTQNMRSLSQLSLAGCTLLTPDAQHIIASGWPGLTNIRLEDCFKVTANGVSSLLDCKSVEDLVLRHNGSGIRRNFVMEAALKFPLLRTLSLDLCDACESGFDTPLYLDRFSLCVVKLSRCKLQKCALEIKDFRMGPKSLQPHRVHKETIILEWTSTDLKTTVVAERI